MAPTEPDLKLRKKTRGGHMREIEVLIISGQDLKNVKHLTKMRTYAVVYVDHEHVSKTHVDEEGGVNPAWNEKLTVTYRKDDEEEEDDATGVMKALNVDIYAHGHVREKPVGSARVLLCDVLKGGDAAEPVDNPIECLTLQVRTPSGMPQGLLNIWVPPTGKFMERRGSLSFGVKDEEVVKEEEKEVVKEEEKVEVGEGHEEEEAVVIGRAGHEA